MSDDKQARREALIAAGEELRDRYGWNMAGGAGKNQPTDGPFVEVLERHLDESQEQSRQRQYER